MAGVRRTKRKDGTYHENWKFWYIDCEEKRRWGTGTPSKKDTLQIARKLEAEHNDIRMGLAPRPCETSKVHAYGDVKDDYLDWGRLQGGRNGRPWGAKHEANRVRHLAWWGQELKLNNLDNLNDCLPNVEKLLQKLKQLGRTNKTLSNYAESLNAFCIWCVERGYMKANPLQHLKAVNTDPESVRRAITPDEFARLIEHASAERALLYTVAAVTGLRAGELSALTPSNLDVGGCGLILDPAWTKNRKPGFQPLPSRLMETLAGLAEFKSHDEPLLHVDTHPSRSMDIDLANAGIPKQTAEGKLDFHALRTAFATFLVESGATIKETQTLMRHADPRITMNVYARNRDTRLAEITETVSENLKLEKKCAIYVQRKKEADDRKPLTPVDATNYGTQKMVEAAGIEPASESVSLQISTCIVRPLGFAAVGRVGLATLGR